ncbi:MAG: hypothetical protein ACRBBR_06645 [Cellvibrionaceae bacterium]
MYFTVSDSLRATIEKIQEKSFLALGANINEIAEKNILNTNKIFKESYGLQGFYKKFKKQPYIIMPEHIYDTSFESFKFMLSFQVTKYDNNNFLGRFANIVPLCHDFFTDGENNIKKNVVVTTLPFLNMNGICFEEERSTYVVFLNDGLLSTIPIIYRYLLPLCEPAWFTGGTPQNNFENVLETIANLYFFKSSYLDTRSSTKIARPGAYEDWLFGICNRQEVDAILKKRNGSINKQDTSGQSELKHPSEYPFNDEMGKFLACRGAFVFLLGHEFSHVYNDHCRYKYKEGLDLREKNFLDQINKKFADEIAKYEGAVSNYENFHINQPLEEEADAHGLQCVLKYCADNDLDSQKTTCVLIGAVATFVVMSIHEQFSAINDFGKESATQYLKINPFVRNMFFSGEHPAPITRLEMALQHGQFQNSSMKKNLLAMNSEIVRLCRSISDHILGNASNIEEFLSSSEMLDSDIRQIFSDHVALGANDLSASHHPRIKKYFSSRESNVVQLFKR